MLISANNSLPDSTANVTSLDAAVSNRDEALDDITEFDDLFQKMGFNQGDENWLSPQDWLQEDASDPGYQLMTDDEIVLILGKVCWYSLRQKCRNKFESSHKFA